MPGFELDPRAFGAQQSPGDRCHYRRTPRTGLHTHARTRAETRQEALGLDARVADIVCTHIFQFTC